MPRLGTGAQAQLLPGSKDGLPQLPEGVAAVMASSSLDAVAAATAAAAAAPPAPLPPPPQAGSSFGRLLQRMGFSSGTEMGGSAAASRAAAASGRAGLLAIKHAPGAGHVLWAETAGVAVGSVWARLAFASFPVPVQAAIEVKCTAFHCFITVCVFSAFFIPGVAPIERVYSGSAGLAGDAVLSFMRALCAVSQEELHPTEPGEPAPANGTCTRGAHWTPSRQRWRCSCFVLIPFPTHSWFQASGHACRCCSGWWSALTTTWARASGWSGAYFRLQAAAGLCFHLPACAYVACKPGSSPAPSPPTRADFHLPFRSRLWNVVAQHLVSAACHTGEVLCVRSHLHACITVCAAHRIYLAGQWMWLASGCAFSLLLHNVFVLQPHPPTRPCAEQTPT